MAVVKRYNPNKLFFSERLMKKLESIYNSNLTLVEAPAGYGKTTSVRNLLKSSDEIVVWITIENEDDTAFFTELCSHVLNIDRETAVKLKNIGCPEEIEAANKIVNVLWEMEITENYIIVFDNFQYISNPYLLSAIFRAFDVVKNNIRFIILTQNVKYDPIIELMENRKINYIGKGDLEFTVEDICMYFRECGVRIDNDTADYLFKYTEGWISAIYLQLLHYVSNNKFEVDTGINKLVCMAIWDKLTVEEQDFLVAISIYDSFSLKQAFFVASEDLRQEEIKTLLRANSFIHYDSADRKYYIHGILRYFLQTEFDKSDKIVKKYIYERAAKWYEENENYYQALLYYSKISKYDDIYYMNISLDDMIPYLTRDNKDMFIQIITHVSIDAKEQNIRRSIMFAFILFVYNEKDFFHKECEMIREMIENRQFLRARERDVLTGEILFVESFYYYNDLNVIYDRYKKAYEYMQSPSTIYSPLLSIIFKNPSVLACFHSRPGEAEWELSKLEETMIFYYKITSGNSKGLEAVMRAEILYNRGEFRDAEILCQKALYMAETRNQVNVYICAMFLMARIAVFDGDYDNMKYILQSIRKKISTSMESEKFFMADLCDGWMYMMLDKCNGMPGWLKNEKAIEEKNAVFTLAVSNVIYAKYLILNHQYSKFLGISGQMLGCARIYNNLMYEIYLYLYIAAANYNTGNQVKAAKFIDEAVELAYKDSFILPFVETYPYIKDIFIPDSSKNAYREFMNQVHTVYKKYEKEFRSVLNSYKEDVDYGLTNRELQIAKLAAKRLSNKEIADQLYIAVGTVKSNLKTIFAKLNIKSRNELKDYFD